MKIEDKEVMKARVVCSAYGPTLIKLCRAIFAIPKNTASSFKLVADQPHVCEPGECPAETCARVAAIVEFARQEIRLAFLESKIQEMIDCVNESDKKREEPDDISALLKKAVEEMLNGLGSEMGIKAKVDVIKVGHVEEVEEEKK